METIAGSISLAPARVWAHREGENQPESCAGNHSRSIVLNAPQSERHFGAVMPTGWRGQSKVLFAGLNLKVVIAVIDLHHCAAEERAIGLSARVDRHRMAVDVCVLPHQVSGS